MHRRRDLGAALQVLRQATDRAVAWRFAGAMALVVATGLMAGLAPLALKGIVDLATVSTAGNQSLGASAIALVAAYLAALCGGRLLSELRPLLIGSAEQRLYARIRRRYVAHVLDLPMDFHLARRTGAVTHSLDEAISGFQIIVFHLTTSVAPVLMELATVTVVLATLHQPVLLATLGTAALAYVVVIGVLAGRLDKSARAVSDANGVLHGMFTDALLNTETIKCFGAQRTIQARFTAASDCSVALWGQFHRERAGFGLALGAIFTAAMSTSLLCAIDGVMQGALTVGGFVMVTVYVLQLVHPLETLGTAARDLSQAIAFVRPLLRILAATPEGSGTEPPMRQDGGRHLQVPHITLRSVKFRYRDGPAVLRRVSLDIPAGASLAIVGASGSGKSSLARLLLGLHIPQAGDIRLDGQSIRELPLQSLRSLVALVPQETLLFNDTIAFNIGIGRPGATRHDIHQAARIACLHDFISSLPAGYDSVVGERGLNLSGGQRQRIAIARAVLRRPAVYVFDEATSMLDSITEREILSNLREASSGCTTITIAHRLSTARHAEEIVVLCDGRVAEQGRHETLLARGRAYTELWNAQRRDGTATVC